MSSNRDEVDSGQLRGSGKLRLTVGRGAEANSRGTGLRIAMITLRLLEHWRTHLELDHDGALVVLATAAITMEKFVRAEFEPELRDIRAEMPSDQLAKCNVSSIAMATGLNRETARRKVRALIEREVLARGPNGSLRLATQYTRSVQTREMLQSHLQAVAQGANALLREGMLDVVEADLDEFVSVVG